MSEEMSPEKIANIGAYPILQFFVYGHLPPHLQEVSKPFADLAHRMAEAPNNRETAVGLRKLLEAKDCAVRAALWC